MTVNPTSSVTGLLGAIGGADATGASSTTTKAGADKDMFLQLLVTQLRYQDPTNPTDSSQFLAQTAQFSALEAMQDVSEKTSALLTAQMSFGAAALVGRTATYLDSAGKSVTGVVDSVAYSADGPQLSIGGATVPLGQVTSVAQTGSGQTGAGSATTPTTQTTPSADGASTT